MNESQPHPILNYRSSNDEHHSTMRRGGLIACGVVVCVIAIYNCADTLTSYMQMIEFLRSPGSKSTPGNAIREQLSYVQLAYQIVFCGALIWIGVALTGAKKWGRALATAVTGVWILDATINLSGRIVGIISTSIVNWSARSFFSLGTALGLLALLGAMLYFLRATATCALVADRDVRPRWTDRFSDTALFLLLLVVTRSFFNALFLPYAIVMLDQTNGATMFQLVSQAALLFTHLLAGYLVWRGRTSGFYLVGASSVMRDLLTWVVIFQQRDRFPGLHAQFIAPYAASAVFMVVATIVLRSSFHIASSQEHAVREDDAPLPVIGFVPSPDDGEPP